MRRFSRTIFSEAVIITAISLLVMILNITPFLVRLYNSTPDKGFAGIQFYSLDYSIYLGHFKEGAECRWLVNDKHTTEPQEGFILRREYILWGLLTGCLLKMPIVYVYHSARIFGGFLLLFLTYALIRKVIPDQKRGENEDPLQYAHNIRRKSIGEPSLEAPLSGAKRDKWLRLTAFTLCTLVAGFPKYITDPATGKTRVDLFMYWFTEVDATQRFATLFHYLLGNSILIGCLLLLMNFLKKLSLQNDLKLKLKQFIVHSSRFLVPIIILGWAAAIIHPSTFVTVYLMFGLYTVIRLFILLIKYVITHHLEKSILYEASAMLLFVMATAPVALILQNEVNRFPWNEIAKWDKAAVAPINFREYYMAIGPIFFLGLAGMFIYIVQIILPSIWLIIKKRFDNETMKQWSNGAMNKFILLTFPTASFLLQFKLWPYFEGINRLRFFQVPIFIPFGIFSAIFLNEIAALLVYLLKKTRLKFNPTSFRFFTLIFALCTLIFVTLPAYRWGIIREVGMMPKGDWFLYPDKKIMDAIDWLDKNTKPEDAVITGWQVSQYLPGFSGNFVYYAHPWSTVNYEQKGILENKFFSTAMSPDEAKIFLSDSNINYVFYSYNERAYNGNIKLYEDFLQKVYETPEVTIYKTMDIKGL